MAGCFRIARRRRIEPYPKSPLCVLCQPRILSPRYSLTNFVQPLDDILTVCEGFSDKKHSCGLEHCEFQITTERNVLLFRAMSREERDAWVQHLRPSRQGYLLHTKVGPEVSDLHLASLV
jgi:hypothetical protein